MATEVKKQRSFPINSNMLELLTSYSTILLCLILDILRSILYVEVVPGVGLEPTKACARGS
jgi:hypothetical protein